MFGIETRLKTLQDVGLIELIGGFYLQPPQKKLVSWDDCSQYNGKIKMVPNHQPVEYGLLSHGVMGSSKFGGYPAASRTQPSHLCP